MDFDHPIEDFILISNLLSHRSGEGLLSDLSLDSDADFEAAIPEVRTTETC